MSKLPDNDDLDKILWQRPAPCARSCFASRIISSSRDVIQRKNITLAVWLRRIFTEFSLPTPSYALTSMLIIGFLLGIGLRDSNFFDTTEKTVSIFNEESIL